MARTISAYSRTVTALKIFLPLAALALLSTMFLFARSREPLNDLPIAESLGPTKTVEERLTGPTYSGLTLDGDAVRMNAGVVLPQVDGVTAAEKIWARLDTSETSHVTVTADHADLYDRKDEIILTGNVRINSSDGYVLNTEKLRSRMEIIEAESYGPVQGYGPLGTLEAGKMLVTTQNAEDDVNMLFTGGVKLVYVPKQEEEDAE